MKKIYGILFLIVLNLISFGRGKYSSIVHTYSIVAIDKESGQMGVAVQSHYFNVGSVVAWAEPGVGVVATQSLVDPNYGKLGLLLMKEGKTAKETLKALIASDNNPEVRQVAMIDIHGNVATHTGKNCIGEAGHVQGDNFSCQANLMKKNTVWNAMAKAFKETKGELADRLLAALKAAQQEGGDIRGKQSAALMVVSIQKTGVFYQDYIHNLRVDDNPEPLKELERLLHISKAYQNMNWGDYYLEKGDVNQAMASYKKALELQPKNIEIKYWFAITLASIGRVEEALPKLNEVFQKEPDWKIVTKRLVKSGLFPDNPKLLKKILNEK